MGFLGMKMAKSIEWIMYIEVDFHGEEFYYAKGRLGFFCIETS